jgi:hypothetical protein
MADKSSFTPDEWKLILEGVMMASVAVTAAEPSGLWGLLKESFAAGTTLVGGKTDAASNALIKAVVADFETSEGRSLAGDGLKGRFAGSKPAEIKAKCLETLRQVGVLVDTKAPRMPRRSRGGCDRSASMCEHQGGGFLGIGGVRVSAAEKATLTEIASALEV